MHRLANPGKIDLEMIEVHVGSCRGEDEIVRFRTFMERDESGLPVTGAP